MRVVTVFALVGWVGITVYAAVTFPLSIAVIASVLAGAILYLEWRDLSA